MAVDALEYDESAEDANPAGALEEILENPERLKDLDLDAFAEELERQVCVRMCFRVCLDSDTDVDAKAIYLNNLKMTARLN